MQKLIIDCDPGVDDAVALFLAFAAPELQILGVTTVAGNVDGAQTARNARLIRQLAGREDVPIHAGAERPLVRKPIEADHFHGESGLGDLKIFEPDAPTASGQAAAFIVETVMREPKGSVALAITGPMTNVAVAMALEPRLAERLGPLAVMGGARSEGGNITPSAEYNIFADPHAAQAVFRSGARITAFGLDVTHQVRATPERTAAIRALHNPRAHTVAKLLDFSSAIERDLVGGSGCPLHDPCPIAWLIAPHLFRTRPCDLNVETGSDLTLGHTAVEFRVDPKAANIHWATNADAEGVFALLTERLK